MIGALLPVLNSDYEMGIVQLLVLIGGMLAVIVYLVRNGKGR